MGRLPLVSWMNDTDRLILEVYDDTELELRPATIARNIDITRDWANKRVRQLADHDLLKPTGNGYYQITELGRQALKGNVPAAELED